jgi:type IV pilus assembly protein PilM
MRHSRINRTIAARDERGGFLELLFNTRLIPSQGCLGIEITDYCIKLVQLISTRKQEMIVEKCFIEKLPQQVVVDGRIMDRARLTQVLQSMMAKLEIKTKKVHLVLPSELIMVRFLKLPDIAHKDLNKLVDFEMKHNIHLPFDSPIYDFTKLNSNVEEVIGMHQCDVMLVAAPKELITEYDEVLTAASLQTLSMEFKALSLFRVMEYSNIVDMNSAVLVIDINEHLSDLSIFHEGQLKITRSIPLDFTIGAANSKVDEDQELFHPYVDQDTEFTNVCHDLGFEMERLINFYRYTLNNRDHEITRVLVAGDVPRLQALAMILAERLNLDIELMKSDRIQSTMPDFDQIFPSIAVPIGLALRGNQR